MVVAESDYPPVGSYWAQHGIVPGYWGTYVEFQSDRDPRVRWGYAHAQELRVDVGQHVEARDVLGITDNTGFTTGAHLHEQLIVDGIRCDPDRWNLV